MQKEVTAEKQYRFMYTAITEDFPYGQFTLCYDDMPQSVRIRIPFHEFATFPELLRSFQFYADLAYVGGWNSPYAVCANRITVESAVNFFVAYLISLRWWCIDEEMREGLKNNHVISIYINDDAVMTKAKAALEKRGLLHYIKQPDKS